MRTRCCSSRLPGSRDSSAIRCGTLGWGSRSYAAGGRSRRAPTERLEGQQAVEETLVAAECDAQLFGRNGVAAGDTTFQLGFLLRRCRAELANDVLYQHAGLLDRAPWIIDETLLHSRPPCTELGDALRCERLHGDDAGRYLGRGRATLDLFRLAPIVRRQIGILFVCELAAGRAGDFRLVPRLVGQTLLPALPVPLRHDHTSFYVAAQPTGPFATARGGGFPQAEPCLTKDAASPYGWSPRRIRVSGCHPRVTLTACVCSPSATWSMRPSAPPCPRARARSTW